MSEAGPQGPGNINPVRFLGVEELRGVGWVRLDEVVAVLRELDPVEAALAGQGAWLLAADLLAERFGADRTSDEWPPKEQG